MKNTKSVTKHDHPATKPNDKLHAAQQWSNDFRTLGFGSQILEQPKQRAAVQETILRAPQEDDWVIRTDDPLAPLKGIADDRVKCRLTESC